MNTKMSVVTIACFMVLMTTATQSEDTKGCITTPGSMPLAVCGKYLAIILQNICPNKDTYEAEYYDINGSQNNKDSKKPTQNLNNVVLPISIECCKRPCSISKILSYCH